MEYLELPKILRHPLNNYTDTILFLFMLLAPVSLYSAPSSTLRVPILASLPQWTQVVDTSEGLASSTLTPILWCVCNIYRKLLPLVLVEIPKPKPKDLSSVKVECAIVNIHFSSMKRLLICMHLLWILCFHSVSMSKLRNPIKGVRGRGCWSKYFYFILKYFYCIKTRKPFKYLQSASLLTAATCFHFHFADTKVEI